MNDQHNDQPRRRWAATLLTRAMPVAAAAVALAAGPLAGVISEADSGAPRAGLVLADDPECKFAAPTTSLNSMKWPLCAGD